MKEVFALLGFCCVTWTLVAQIELSGIVLSEDQSPLAYALVSVYPLSDSTRISSALSDEKGYFEFELAKANYQLTIQMLGHESYTKLVQLVADYSIGTLLLKEEIALLKTVEVSATRFTVESHLGKKVLFVGQDIANTGSTALEALEQIPAIRISSRGEVQVRGNSNVIVYINGKETQRDPSSLAFISADVLEKIELITNPSAKYDAEGVGGIINLVYKKNTWTQFKLEAVTNLTILTNPLELNPSGAFNLSYNKDRFSFFCNVSYDYDRYTDYIEYQRIHFWDELYRYDNNLAINGTGSIAELNVGLAFEPDTTFSLGLELNYDQWDFRDRRVQRTSFYFLQEPAQFYKTPNATHELENELWINGSLEKKFRPKHILKLSLAMGGEEEVNNRKSETVESGTTTELVEQFLRHSEETEGQRYYQAKLEYQLPFFQFGELETGAKLDVIDYDILQFAQLQSDSIVLPENDFRMDMQKLGIYALQRHIIKKVAYELGLRIEQFSSTAIQQSNHQAFEQKYLQLFPSVQVNYLLNGHEHSLGFGYTRRINRPSFFELNPYISYRDPFNLETGNPALRPEIGQLYELNYHREIQNWTIDLALFQRTTLDAIQGRIFSLGQEQTLTSPVNIGKSTAQGTELQVEHRAGKWLKTSVTLVAGKSDFEDLQQQITFNNKLAWRTRLNQQLTLPNNWKIQWTAMYRAARYEIQEKRQAAFYMNAAISKKLKNQKGSMTLAIRDLLNSKNYNYNLLTSDFEVAIKNKWQTRQITFGLRYNLINNKQ